MCLALIAWRAHPRLPLVIAANRDEFHARATAPAQWWPDGILGGKDLVAGGTWLGCTRTGRFALLTNFREGGTPQRGERSRGLLVSEVLQSSASPEQTILRHLGDANRYDGFNLVAGDGDELVYLSNRDGGCRALPPGVYGLSNHLLDTPWPKLHRSKNRMVDWLDRGDGDVEALFHLLRDPQRPEDHLLPSTGISLEWERLLAAAFIVSPIYGTRSATVLTLGNDRKIEFFERSFDPAGEASGERHFSFVVGAP